MHGVGVYDESAGELVGPDVVTRERAADDVRGVLCVKALVKQLQNHGCNEAFSADLAAAESTEDDSAKTSALHAIYKVFMLRCSRLPVLLAALFEGGGSPLPVGLIICAISGWFCFSSRILVISRVKAAGSFTSVRK